MKAFLRWFRARHSLITELNNLDKATRELTYRFYAAEYTWGEIQNQQYEMVETICGLQDRLAGQHLMLSALGTVEESRASADG